MEKLVMCVHFIGFVFNSLLSCCIPLRRDDGIRRRKEISEWVKGKRQRKREKEGESGRESYGKPAQIKNTLVTGNIQESYATIR